MADTSERVLSLAGCDVAKLSHAEPDAKFDIVLHAPEVNGQTELAVVYNADLFSANRIATLLQQFDYLLSQVVADPAKSINQFSLAAPAFRAVLPDATEPLDDTWEGAIHDLFSEQARLTPDKLAVVDSSGPWTYRDLDQISSQLAGHFAANGVRRRDIVAIYGHRSSPLVLALLGVLKAGAVFMILDPGYPAARLIEYLRIARPKAWIGIDAAGEPPEELGHYLDGVDLSCRVNLPAEKHAIADLLNPYSAAGTPVAVGAIDPAYVAFTSGSTGEPKGVLSRHGAITHFLPWQKQAFDLDETDRFAMLSGLAYSHLHRDVFTALYLGATLVIPDPDVARAPERLVPWLKNHQISILHLTPALGQLLLAAGGETLPAVRRIFFGGDILSWHDVARIRELAPNAKIGSFYGATETQRAVGYYEISEELTIRGADAKRAVPLGRGIKDVQLLLLNKNRQLAGIGELGELYVRSPHLAEGYMGDDKRTEEMFLINPFTDNPEDRLYKSGELGRYLPDGNVEWAGRNDRRVNIRGFRVELEEIETLLKQHPTVANAAVVLLHVELANPENPKSDSRLVAYVAADENGQGLIDLLRSFLSARLPDYMVPSHFVILEQLPLNPNGKVDYQTLPPVQPLRSGSSILSATPRNDVEAKLCDTFAEVLGREHVGIDENFFRIGGHSLLAAQAAARIREAFGTNFELRRFFEAPTVAALAKEIEVRLKGIITAPIIDDSDREEIEI